MALRRTRQPVNTTEHLMAFMLKHEETIARLDKELRELTVEVKRLANLPKPGIEVTAHKPAPAPTPQKAPKTERNNHVYTPDEIALATMLYQEGATTAAIAAVLKRTERGIEGLLKRLRQGDSTIGQDRHAKRKAGK